MSSEQLNSTIKKNRQTVYSYIDKFLSKDHQIDELRQFYQILRDYPSRPSKGLRAALCSLTCETFGGNSHDTIITAAGLELFQSWVLIHDDIEDDSEFRRGQPVLHRKHGIPLAINAGDALHGKMWEIILGNQRILGDQKTLLILANFRKMLNETTEGQHLELSWVKNQRWDLQESDYFLMCEKKTSWYTCIAPMRMGAIIAGADNKIWEKIIPLGAKLGVAFQIQDDILNLSANKEYGKEIVGDIYEGKRTLILINFLKNCNSKEREEVIAILNKPRSQKTVNEIKRVVDLIRSSGALEYAKKTAMNLTNELKHNFEVIFSNTNPTESKDILRELLDYLVSRKW